MKYLLTKWLINQCTDCPFCHDKPFPAEDDYVCEELNKDVDGETIDPACPLADAKED